MFKYFDTYQEGMDILMFRETGMVGLQSEKSNITICLNCTKHMNVAVNLNSVDTL